MGLLDELSRVRSLSDEALLLGLSHSLRANRRTVADIVTHLGEVEERQLHLLGGYSSLFAYCTTRLRMSEDEAYRRLEVARLVRCFPRLLELLATGQISLSVAALLKARLTDANHEALLAALSGKTVAQAREVLAAWFPQPDVLPLLRKLPARRAPAADARASAPATAYPLDVVRIATPDATPPDATRTPTQETERENAVARATQPIEPMPSRPGLSPPQPRRAGPTANTASASRSLEPLSPERYKLQLTISAELKGKLDLARDLLRHAIPSGELPALLERAIDLLLEQTQKRRFARKKTARPNPSPPKNPPEPEHAERRNTPTLAPTGSPAPASAEPASIPSASVPPAAASAASRHIPNAARRAVLERDGLQCTWQGPDGTRCNSRAWLEHDHIIPRGKGGTHDPSNGRILCRPHNRLAAEQTYGRATITRILARRRSAPSANPPQATPVTSELESRPPIPPPMSARPSTRPP